MLACSEDDAHAALYLCHTPIKSILVGFAAPHPAPFRCSKVLARSEDHAGDELPTCTTKWLYDPSYFNVPFPVRLSFLPCSKVLARSEDDADDELLSCAVVKGGKKVVCGTQSGVMALYSWGYFNDCSDRCGSDHFVAATGVLQCYAVGKSRGSITGPRHNDGL